MPETLAVKMAIYSGGGAFELDDDHRPTWYDMHPSVHRVSVVGVGFGKYSARKQVSVFAELCAAVKTSLGVVEIEDALALKGCGGARNSFHFFR